MMKGLLDFFYRKQYCKTTYAMLALYAFQSVAGGLSYYITLFLNSHTQFHTIGMASIVSSTFAGNTIGSLAGGHFLDKYSPSYSMKFGAVVQGVALFALIFAKSFFAFCSLMFLMGLGSFFYITSASYILTTKHGKSSSDRKTITSDLAIFSNMGMLFGSLLMGVAAQGYYPYIFACVSVLLIGLSLSFGTFDLAPKDSISPKRKESTGLADRNSLFCSIGFFSVISMGVVFGVQKIGNPIYLHDYHGNIGTGVLMMLNPLVIIVFQSSFLRFVSNYDDKLALAVGFVLFGVSFLVLDASPSALIVSIACIIATLAEMIVPTYATALVFGHAPKGKEGVVFGSYKSIYALSRVGGAHIAGWMIYFMSISTLWLFCFCFSISSALLVLVMYNKKQKAYS